MSGIDLELIAVGVLLVALIATSIVGNILVCIAVATDNNLRKLSNLFLVSLAIADLLVAGTFTGQSIMVRENPLLENLNIGAFNHSMSLQYILDGMYEKSAVNETLKPTIKTELKPKTLVRELSQTTLSCGPKFQLFPCIIND